MRLTGQPQGYVGSGRDFRRRAHPVPAGSEIPDDERQCLGVVTKVVAQNHDPRTGRQLLYGKAIEDLLPYTGYAAIMQPPVSAAETIVVEGVNIPGALTVAQRFGDGSHLQVSRTVRRPHDGARHAVGYLPRDERRCQCGQLLVVVGMVTDKHVAGPGLGN